MLTTPSAHTTVSQELDGKYDAKLVLHDISLRHRPKSCMTTVAAGVCGKSTLSDIKENSVSETIASHLSTETKHQSNIPRVIFRGFPYSFTVIV